MLLFASGLLPRCIVVKCNINIHILKQTRRKENVLKSRWIVVYWRALLKFNTDTETDRYENLKKFKNGRHISIKISETLQNMVSCMILMLRLVLLGIWVLITHDWKHQIESLKKKKSLPTYPIFH